MGCPRDGTPAGEASSARSPTPAATASPAASTVSQTRKRTRSAAQPRRSSMQTRAKGKAPTSATPFRIILQSSVVDEAQLGEWQGALPQWHSKNKTVDQCAHDDESERQQAISRPQGVERAEYLETHLQHALGGPGAHTAASYIPIPPATTISDEQYRALYPLTLKEKKKQKPIKTRRRHLEFRTSSQLYATYFMDEMDRDWLDENNRTVHASQRATSSQPGASTSSSTTACELDDPMDLDDETSIIRIKTEPLPDRSSVLRSPAVCTPSRRQTEPLPERLLSPNGMGPPPLIEHQIQDASLLSEDELEFIMHHLEVCAFRATRNHSPSIETLRSVMELEFPLRVCTFIHECTSARSRLRRIPCICTQLSVVYPHWLRRRVSRDGRSLFPQLQVPKDISQDGEDPYIVFRDTNEQWKRDLERPAEGRSRNPRRDAKKQKKLQEQEERLRRMPKRVRLTVNTPPPQPPPPPAPAPTSAPSAATRALSNTGVTPAPSHSNVDVVPVSSPVPAPAPSNAGATRAPLQSNTVATPAPNPPTPPPNTAVHTPPTPCPAPLPLQPRVPSNGTPRLVPVPVVEDVSVKDQSQTPVDVSSPPYKAATFFSVADARSAAENVIMSEHIADETLDTTVPMDISREGSPSLMAMSPLTEPPTFDPSDPDA